MNQQEEAAEIVVSGQPKLQFNHATKDINVVLMDVLSLEFYSVKLEGYERKKIFSFAQASSNFTDNPTLTAVNSMLKLNDFRAIDISAIANENTIRRDYSIFRNMYLTIHTKNLMQFFYSIFSSYFWNYRL